MKTNELKATDLMIGDWLKHYNGTPMQVTKITTEHFACAENRGMNCWEYNNKYEPIPLTPEILEKNGFEDTICDAIWISTNCNLLWKDGKLKNFCREEDDEVCIPCEYVHELQHALKLCKIDKEIVV
jgi:hypothetical protein